MTEIELYSQYYLEVILTEKLASEEVVLVEPRTLKGFVDHLPEAAGKRKRFLVKSGI